MSAAEFAADAEAVSIDLDVLRSVMETDTAGMSSNDGNNAGLPRPGPPDLRHT